MTGPDSSVLAEDVVGYVNPRDQVVAVGAVPEGDARFLQRGDSAVVRFLRAAVEYGGRVEQVRFPEPGRARDAEVAVKIRHELAAGPLGTARVTVVPFDLSDSVWAIPAAALAHGSFGGAVFSPAGRDAYRVTWIGGSRRRAGQVVLLSEDLGRLSQVVTHGLPMLVEAVEDSLRARRAAAF
jgi:hypothetical protein